jgi:hypothetical protein
LALWPSSRLLTGVAMAAMLSRNAVQVTMARLLSMLAEMPVGVAVKERRPAHQRRRRNFGKAPADEGKVVDPCWRAQTIE